MRRWEDIRQSWLDYIPRHDPPWPVPEHEIHELPSLAAELKALVDVDSRATKRNVDRETIEYEVEGLRVGVLLQANHLVFKAAHVLRAMAAESNAGYRTWSRSSAYQSAVFASQGILALLGVVLIPESRKRDYQIDIWAPRRKAAAPNESLFAVRIIPRPFAGHKGLWSLFHHVLCATKVDQRVWPHAGNDILKKLDTADFYGIRHRLHYRVTGWLYDDMTDVSVREDLSTLAEDVLGLFYLDKPEDGRFPVSLALHLLSLALALLTSLGTEEPKVSTEAERVRQWMEGSPWGCANVFELRRT